MKLSTFQSYLASKSPVAAPPRSQLNKDDQQLLNWAATLPMMLEEEQFEQLETILSQLSVAHIDDGLRLRLMNVVTSAADRLIAMMQSRYSHELGTFNPDQLRLVDKIRSLYYQMLLIFEGMIDRESTRSQEAAKRQQDCSSVWQKMTQKAPEPPLLLASSLYQALLIYQKLLYSFAICYQKAPATIWQAVHKRYAEACRYQLTHVNLSAQVVTKSGSNIHQIYCQICLYSLLNVMAMGRPSLLLIQRLLPDWALQIKAALQPQSDTRIFVDLNADFAPEYLTPTSRINPYAEDQNCLFIELEPLADYLKARQSVLLTSNTALTEYRLVTKILMAISHRYLNRQSKVVSKYAPKSRATLITQFNAIHYYAAGNKSLMELISRHDISLDYLPQYDTAPKKGHPVPSFEVEVHDSDDQGSHFRTLRLLTNPDIAAFSQSKGSQLGQKPPMTPPLNEIFEPITLEAAKAADDELLSAFLSTAPPHLQIMSLFLLTDHKACRKDNWALGLVRWLTLNDEFVEVESQTLGHAPTACALRLDGHDHRSQSFVPALLLGAEKSLGTNCSLLVPSYHFKAEDKVVLRLNDKQKTLRLKDSILRTEEFTQFEVILL